ncbi:hypothetical protein [Hyphococcus sp.]|uniref:hypothetical protein n=2 Tax=Hyphococcus sp. TaxID=2038636 RepID=UPI0035C6B708
MPPSFLNMTCGQEGGVVFLTARAGRTTLNGLRVLDKHGVIGVIDYPRLALSSSFRASAVVICDIERMTPDYESRVIGIVRKWRDHPAPPAILNEPPRPLRRYELLKKLHKLGVNRKDICRLDDPDAVEKVGFPCFIRDEAGHHLTPDHPRLLHSRDELQTEIDRLEEAGVPRFGKIVVEFEDTRDDTGMYCKLAYYKAADALIPAHSFWNPEWFVKYPKPGLVAERPDLVEREREFVMTSPHETEIARIFDVAGIDYGRIDYGLRRDGGLHIFEINTNPNHSHPGSIAPERQPHINPVQERIVQALERLVEQNPCTRLAWPRDELLYRLRCQL